MNLLKSIEAVEGNEKLLFNEGFDVSCEDDVFVQFTKPFLLHSNRSYKIRLFCNKFTQFQCPSMKFGEITIGDLEINLLRIDGTKSDFILLSKLYCNQLYVRKLT